MLSKTAEAITTYLQINPEKSSREIFEAIQTSSSYATIKRELNDLVEENLVLKKGNGKATKYSLHDAFAIMIPLDVQTYFKEDIDQRRIKNTYDFDIIKIMEGLSSVFTADETDILEKNQKIFAERLHTISPELYKKEFERLAIDLSWKSSQIEGNTYSLLETERLIKDKITASGKTRDEATMLLNHKEAIDFMITHQDEFERLTVRAIEEIHSLLVKELNVSRNIRQRRVGITGTNYRPLDNEYQIREALESMCRLMQSRSSVFEKALLSLILISYIQPFEDGNKRTARLICNALLIHHQYCPISFRGVDPIAYKEAMLIFYEQNNLSAIKKLFIEQFDFAVQTYF